MSIDHFEKMLAAGGNLELDIRYAEIQPNGHVFVLSVGGGYQLKEMALPAEHAFMQELGKILERGFSGRIVFAPICFPDSTVLMYRQPFQLALQFFKHIKTTRADADGLFDMMARGIDSGRVIEGDESELMSLFINEVKVEKTTHIQSVIRASKSSGSLLVYTFSGTSATLLTDRPYLHHQVECVLERLGNPVQAHIFVSFRDSQKCLFCFTRTDGIERTSKDLLMPESVLLQARIMVRRGQIQLSMKRLAKDLESSMDCRVTIEEHQTLLIEKSLHGNQCTIAPSRCSQFKNDIKIKLKAASLFNHIGFSFIIEPGFYFVFPGGFPNEARISGTGFDPYLSTQSLSLANELDSRSVDKRASRLLDGLSLSYSCHYDRDALIALRGALEAAFIDEIDQQNQKLVSNEVRNLIEKTMKEAGVEPKERGLILSEIGKLKTKTQNTVIQEEIARILDRKLEDVKELMRSVSSARGTAAHTTTVDTDKIREATSELREVIRELILRLL